MPNDLSAIRERLKELSETATQAPWRYAGNGEVGAGPDGGWSVIGDFALSDGRIAPAVFDANLIAESRNALPALLDALDAAEEVLSLAAPEYCSMKCPSVKRTGNPWLHVDGCKEINAALALLRGQKDGDRA